MCPSPDPLTLGFGLAAVLNSHITLRAHVR